jgi:hypothetical protein
LQRKITSRGVVVASLIKCERINTRGCVLSAAGVARERLKTIGGIVVAGGVAGERIKPRGSVVIAVVGCAKTVGRVLEASCIF